MANREEIRKISKEIREIRAQLNKVAFSNGEGWEIVDILAFKKKRGLARGIVEIAENWNLRTGSTNFIEFKEYLDDFAEWFSEKRGNLMRAVRKAGGDFYVNGGGEVFTFGHDIGDSIEISHAVVWSGSDVYNKVLSDPYKYLPRLNYGLNNLSRDEARAVPGFPRNVKNILFLYSTFSFQDIGRIPAYFNKWQK